MTIIAPRSDDSAGVPKLLKDNTLIWKYTEFWKFKDIIENKRLFFCSADVLIDKYEGNYPTNLNVSPEFKEKYYNSSIACEAIKPYFFINCWHINQVESHYMWLNFAKQKVDIAIQTSIQNFYELFYYEYGFEIQIGQIDYIDHKCTDLIDENISDMFFLKDENQFSEEKELRALFHLLPNEQFNPAYVGKTKDGIYLKVNIDKLFQNIYVAPTADINVINCVNELLISNGFKVNIIHSAF